MNRVGIIVAGLTLASGLIKADVIVLPDAAYSWQAQGGPYTCNPTCQAGETVSGTTPGGGELSTYSGAAETYPGLPNPMNLLDPYAFARFADGATQQVHSYASATYFFEVVDPNGGTGLVPVNIQYSETASYRTPGGVTQDLGGSQAGVAVYLYNGTPTQVFHYAECAATDCDQSSSGVLHLMADLGQVYFLYVSATAGGTYPDDSGSASADPYIYIDPNVTGYQLVLSDGVSNLPPDSGSSVPEPASFVLAGVGLIATAGFRRRFSAFLFSS
jgi:hypothetical protein